MSATLRYDIGVELYEAIVLGDRGLMARLGAKQAARWAGRDSDRWRCYTFSIKLPGQVADAVQLIKRDTLLRLIVTADPALTRSSRTLSSKIARSLGIENYAMHGQCPEEERGFLEAISAEPGELGNWSAYADYLQDHKDDRGLLIAGWLGPKALRVSNGVPELAGRFRPTAPAKRKRP